MADYRAKIAAEKAARDEGLLPRALVKDLVPGAVWLARDDALLFPEDRLPSAGDRAQHDFRRVVIVQSLRFTRDRVPVTLLVVPCSSSQHPSELLECDFSLPDRPAGFTHPYVVAYTRLVQPILKSDLERCTGRLTDTTYRALRRKLAEVLDLTELPMMEMAARESHAADE